MGANASAKRAWMATAIVLLIVAVDQAIKVWVKTHMALHESIHVADWFYISFIENNGMAYGMTFIPKVGLSLFRIVAVVAIGVYIARLVKQGARWGYIATLAMVMAGAAGNIFDCLFYGQVFSESTPYDVSRWVPWGEGYAPVLQGRVVDMFYFPIIDTHWPQWMPVWGGEHFIFFSPVFNFADACISVGVVVLLLFYRRELGEMSLSGDGHGSHDDDSHDDGGKEANG